MITDTRSPLRSTFGSPFGYDLSSPSSEKAVLRKRPRVNDEDLGKQSKKLSLHKVLGRGLRRQYDYQTPEPSSSSTDMDPTCYYTEDMIQVIDEGAESDLLGSDVYSYDQEAGTPVSKTKKIRGLHRWLGKIHHYGRQARLSKLRHERTASRIIRQKILNPPIGEDVPDDAYSCYQQYKTENFERYFDTLMLKSSSSENTNGTDQIPVYSPINELTYENLQSLRKQLFTLPPLTGVSNSESENEPTLKLGHLREQPDKASLDEELVINMTQALSDTATAETISEVGTPSDGDTSETSAVEVNQADQFHPLLRLAEQQHSPTSSIGAQQDSAEAILVPLNTPDTEYEEERTINYGDLLIEHRSKESSEFPDRNEVFSPTTEVLKDFFENTEPLGSKYEYGVDSPNFKETDALFLSETILNQQPKISSSSSLPRSRSVLKRVISAFNNDKRCISDLNSASSHSTYCPISVVVPALKQDHNIISGIAGNLSEGLDIDDRYDPDDFSSHSDPESHKLGSIKDPRFYMGISDSQDSPESPGSGDNTKIASIKFDKFAQLLLYDGSKRSRYEKSAAMAKSSGKENINHQADIEKRSEKYKNRGSLNLNPSSALPPNSMHRLRTLKLSTLSKFSTHHTKTHITPPYLYSSIDQIVSTLSDPLVSVRPILKSKHNVNASVESVRANYCDRVEVEDFMDFFEDYERHRTETEPYLGKVRERQLMKYYNSSESTSPTTEDSAMTV